MAEGAEEAQVVEGVEEEVEVEAPAVEGVTVAAMVETVIIHTNNLYILRGYLPDKIVEHSDCSSNSECSDF